MFVTTGNNMDRTFKNIEKLTNFLRQVPIDDWPTAIWRQIDSTNMRKIEIIFDTMSKEFTIVPGKLSM